MAGRAPPPGPNFKTDVHRNVTKKWAGARNVAYDGDDWGGYDEYDDAGYADEPPPPMPNTTAAGKPTGLRQRGQVSVREPPSSTQPANQVPQQPQQQQQLSRTGSFDYGDDGRDFSAAQPGAAGPPPQGQWATSPRGSSRPTSGTTQASYKSLTASSDRDAYQRHDYPPSAVPPPLSQRSPATAAMSDRDGQSFPPRTSSERPDVSTFSPTVAPDSDAPRPLFVRPADIYKRMEAEREKERQSMDSSRPSGPSIDNARSVAAPPTIAEAPSRLSHGGPAEMEAGPVLTSGTLGGLRSGFGMDGLPIREESASKGPVPREESSSKTTGSPLLPNLDRFSGFGSDLWGSSGFSEPSEVSSTAADPRINRSEVSAMSDAPLKEQSSMGFRSAVERAFDDQGASTLAPVGQSTVGSQRSADGSDFSRTDSTAGVSPIISRMPSGATAAMRAQEREDRHEASPAIAEEPTSATGSRQASGTTVKGPTAEHSRHASGGSTASYRRNMDMPSPGNSPARHPALAINNTLQPPAEGELAVTTPVEAATQQGRRSPVKEPADVTASSRASSPSKGRVADLANKYDTNSRRNSGSSIASWASSKRSASPVKDAAGNGVSAYQTSDALQPPSDPARPHLPGEWVSYNTNATEESGTSLAETRTITQDASEKPEAGLVPDFKPSKSTAAPSGFAAAGPMAALASAGAAIAASLTQVAGNAGATGERDFASSTAEEATPVEPGTRQLAGEVAARGPTSLVPQSLDASPMVGPTPPPKDTPLTETINRMSGYFPNPPAPLKGGAASQLPSTRETLAHGSANGTSANESESDRLTKEIERSLTPSNANTASATSASQLVPPSPIIGSNNGLRESSVLPHEYDSYWNGSEFDEKSQPSRGASGAGIAPASLSAERSPGRQLSDTPAAPASPRPGMLANRFSWEADDEPAAGSIEPSTTEQVEASKPSQEVFGGPTALAEANQQMFGSSELPSPAVAPAALPNIKTSLDNQTRGLEGGQGQVGGGTGENSMTLQSAGPNNSNNNNSSTLATSSTSTATPITAVLRTPATPSAGQRAAWVHPAPLKELMELNPPSARVERCNQIRTQYGTMETGLDSWLSFMVTSHPEHGSAALAAPHLTADSSGGLAGSMRNKISPAMSKFTQAATGSAPTQDPSFKGRSPSQSKGKDLFGSIGGKASHSAKGLFAKGKQKLRAASTEKASTPPPSSYSSSSAPFTPPTSSNATSSKMSRFFRRAPSQGDVLSPISQDDTDLPRSAAAPSVGSRVNKDERAPPLQDSFVSVPLFANPTHADPTSHGQSIPAIVRLETSHQKEGYAGSLGDDSESDSFHSTRDRATSYRASGFETVLAPAVVSDAEAEPEPASVSIDLGNLQAADEELAVISSPAPAGLEVDVDAVSSFPATPEASHETTPPQDSLVDDLDVLTTNDSIGLPPGSHTEDGLDHGQDAPIPVERETRMHDTSVRPPSRHDPVVISQREGPSNSPTSRPFANARNDYERPQSSHSARSRSRSRSMSNPAEASSIPAMPMSPPPRQSLPPPRPVLVSSPSEDIAFARATTNRRPQSEYMPKGQMSGQQWYTPSDPASRRYIDARTYSTEYAIPGLGPDFSLPAFDQPKNEAADESPVKGKRESKVKSLYGRLRSRSRSRSRSGVDEIPPPIAHEPMPVAAGRPLSSGPAFFPMHNTAGNATTTAAVNRGTGSGCKTPSPTRIDPRLSSQNFTVSPDLDDLEDGRRLSIMHDPDPLPHRTLARTSKTEEAEQRRTLRRRPDVITSEDDQKQNRRSWFGGMFASARPRSSSRTAADPATNPPQMPAETPTTSRGPSDNPSSAAAAAAAIAFKAQPERKPTNKLSKAPSARVQQQRMRPTQAESASASASASTSTSIARGRPISMPQSPSQASIAHPAQKQQPSTYGHPQHPLARETTSYTPTRDPTLPNLTPLSTTRLVSTEAGGVIDESLVHPAHRQSLPPPSRAMATSGETERGHSDPVLTSSALGPSATARSRSRSAHGQRGSSLGQPPRDREEYVRFMQAQGFFPDRQSPRGEGPAGSGLGTSKRRSPERTYGVPGWGE